MNESLADNTLPGEKFSAALADSLRGIVYEADPSTFRFSFVSSYAEKLLGYPVCRWIGEPDFWRDHIHPDDVEECVASRRDAAAEGTDRDCRYRMIATDGRVVWLHDMATVAREEGGAVRLRGIMIDVTASRQTEEKLRSSEERFQLALRGANDGLWDWNLLTDEVYYSPRWKSMLGYAEEELANHLDTWKRLVHPADRDPALALAQDFAEGRVGKYEIELRMRHKDGHYLTVLSRAFLARDARGEAVRMVGTHVDMTDSKRAEEELRLKSFTIDNLAEEIIWTTPDGRIWNVNDFACTRLGYTREELLSLTISDIDPLFPKEAWRPHWEELTRLKSRKFESLHKTKDGRVYPVEIIANRFVRNGLDYNCAIVRDITEHKKLEKALQESEEQFRTLSDCAPIGIFRADSEGNNVYINPRWEEITGMSAAEGMGKGWLRAIHPDDRERLGEVWREAMTTGRIYSHEHRQLTPQGKPIWVRALANPIKGADGKTVGYVGTLEDITELQRARQEMLKAQKLESLGLLAGGIAHDFNNILTTILGSISLARLQSSDPDKVSKRLEDAEKATVRAKDLTQQLLTFARGGEPIKKVVRLGNLLREAAGFAIHGTAVRCEFILADDLWPVEADEGQLSQVIHNLVLNAVQSMPNGGTLTIGAGNISSLREGKRFVTISVADTGGGIPEHDLQRIFDPYFTTKQQGSGLGLATCYSIVRKHGGKIRATSTLGKGSTFYISLPAADREWEGAPSPQPPVSGGSGRMLVMDDEDGVREIARAMLEELGYTVECAENGTEAIELYRQRMEQGTPFSAVILDLTVPGGVGGREAIERLREIDPDVKAIVSSGYSTDPVMANYREYGFSAVLTKPYRPQEMDEVLRSIGRGTN